MQLANILLVEDTEAHIKLTEHAIKKAKIVAKLHVVRDGEQALDYMFKRNGYEDVPRPDLILLDLKLPKYNGKEVLRIIKDEPSLQNIPVVILTTSTALLDIDDSYQAHANSYITKPVSFEGLIKTLISINEFWFVVSTLPPSEEE